MSNPVRLPAPRKDLQHIVEAIVDTVYRAADGYSMVEAIGALEMAKLQLIDDQKERLNGG